MTSPLLAKICNISPKYVAFGVVLLSALALGGALVGQYMFGLHPCELCIYQRVPFVVTIILGLVAFFWTNKRLHLIMLSGLVLLINAAIAFFHSGVERKWWAGLTGCSTPDMSGSIDELMARIQETAVTRCDEISWSFMGLSMANYNVAYCIILGLFCCFYGCSRLKTR